MTATKNIALVSNKNGLIIVAGVDALTLDLVKSLVGRTVEMPTNMAGEKATYTIEKVSQNRATGDLMAWMTRPGVGGGIHARLITKR